MESNSQKRNIDSQKIQNLSKWQFAVESSMIGIWDYDFEKDEVFFSDESKLILGYEKHENVLGNKSHSWNERVHPDDREQYNIDFQNHLDGKTEIYENEHRVLCKNGSYKWILDRGKVILRDKDLKPLRITGTHTDINNRVEIKESLNENFNLITKQNKKLTNFAHIVTHNLKQHSGNFESLLSFYDDAETEGEKKELMDYLKALSNSLNQTITNLNQIVSVQAKKEITVERLYLNEYIDRALEILKVPITQDNATINNFIDDGIFIYFSPAYMESIVQNLISNALKYKHPDRDPVINVTYSIVGDNMYFNVSDNGIGIDLDKYKDDVFGLYKTFHKNEDSEGVGLYLIKNQVESFGGSIDVSSIVNVGTTFTITIPNKIENLS